MVLARGPRSLLRTFVQSAPIHFRLRLVLIAVAAYARGETAGKVGRRAPTGGVRFSLVGSVFIFCMWAGRRTVDIAPETQVGMVR